MSRIGVLSGLVDDKRWKYGVPPKKNANFAWVQHIIHHLAPSGIAGFVLSNSSMSSNQSSEGEIRKNLIEANLVDCMVALPKQLFYSTQIPACLWFIARDRYGGKLRDRRGEILFIDMQDLGCMVDRTHREITNQEISLVSETYHAWRSQDYVNNYNDVPGFCKSATKEEVSKRNHALIPRLYVGAKVSTDDSEPFFERMNQIVKQLREQQKKGAEIDKVISRNLTELGFGE